MFSPALLTLSFVFSIDYCNGLTPHIIRIHSFSSPKTLTSFVSPLRSSSQPTSALEEKWKWKGRYDIHTEYSPALAKSNSSNKPDVMLVHGFGCSTTYWRATTKALAEAGYNVHALDLLGQGKSSKPGRKDGVIYSIDLWSELVDDYAREKINIEREQDSNGRGIVLMGNSLGSLVALNAATGDYLRKSDKVGYLSEQAKNRMKGICMFNCGVGLNSRGIANDAQLSPQSRFLFNLVLNILDLLIFNNIFLLNYVLNNVVTKELLRDTLKNLYISNPDRVDDELVDSFYFPAKDAGSPEALSQIYTNDPGRNPFDIHQDGLYAEILQSKGVSIQFVWGDKDGITPLDGGVGQFYSNLSKKDDNIKFNVVKNCGHIPFDDCPEQSNLIMLNWLDKVVVNSNIG